MPRLARQGGHGARQGACIGFPSHLIFFPSGIPCTSRKSWGRLARGGRAALGSGLLPVTLVPFSIGASATKKLATLGRALKKPSSQLPKDGWAIHPSHLRQKRETRCAGPAIRWAAEGSLINRCLAAEYAAVPSQLTSAIAQHAASSALLLAGWHCWPSLPLSFATLRGGRPVEWPGQHGRFVG